MPRSVALMLGIAIAVLGDGGTTLGQPPTNVDPGDVGSRGHTPGEPCRMEGSRIVFTDWRYVAPGTLNWVDEHGASVAADPDARIGDWGARFKTNDVPRGIRIVAQPAERRSDIIARERPWEARSIGVKTLLKDVDVYRLWGSSVDAAGRGHDCIYESADGRAPDVFSIEHADTQNVGTYDPLTRTYAIFTRTWWLAERDPRASDEEGQAWYSVGRRAIGRTESATFGTFPVSRMVMAPTPDMLPGEVLYTNCYTTVPRAPGLRLMVPAIWNMESDATRLMLATSPDGRVWNWVPGGTVLDTGDFQTFDGGCLFASPNLTETAGGDFVLPYSGYRFPHKYPRGHEDFPPNLGFAVWRKGRIIALEAVQRGSFAMIAIVPPGPTLRINATTRRGGSIRIEACDLQRRPLPGRAMADSRPIIGDQFNAPVTWSGGDDLGIRPGQAVVLRFELDQAKIFSLDFEPADPQSAIPHEPE